MQAARLGLRAALRNAPGTLPRIRPRIPLLLPKQQSRFASFRYQRFGDQKSEQPYSSFGPVFRAQYIWRNYRPVILGVGGAGLVVYVYNLEETPITKRRRFNIVSHELEKELAKSGYQDILRQFQGRILPESHPYTQLVARVTERLLPASGLANEEWRVHVIDDKDQVNAFVTPDYNVFVFTGILPVCENEDGLAAVLGHEIAHNVAHHMAERLSGSIFVALASIIGALLFDVSGQLSGSIANIVMSMPNSRTQEREADHIGLLIMAESCYDPSTALDFWGRMAEAQKLSPPEFLSTHPSDYNRRELIRTWLPQAMDKFEQGGCSITASYKKSFSEVFKNQGQRSRAPQQVYVGRRDDDDDFF